MDQLSDIVEGEHGKFIGKKFVVCDTSKCVDAEVSQTGTNPSRLEANNGRCVWKNMLKSGCEGLCMPG